jgi:imidazolonepropionase
VFCDRGAFDVIESRRVLETARDLGFSLRVHAEELARTGATQLACELGARSADHLEHISSEDVQAMAHADVAAVLLPLVTAFLDLPERAPARELANAGVRIAVSTDYNPGSAHSISMQLALSLACSLHKLSPAEGLRGVTRVPAEIVGRPLAGIIKQGAPADLLEFDVSSWDAIPYFMTDAPMTRLPL